MLHAVKNLRNKLYGWPVAEDFANVNFRTPDIWSLEMHHCHRLFIYDEMQKGHPHHDIIKDNNIWCANGYTCGVFSLWKKKLGKESTAVALAPSAAGNPEDFEWTDQHQGIGAPIRGELYGIPSNHFLKLDNYKENTVQYIRVRVNVCIPYRFIKWNKQQGMVESKEEEFITRAWMYVGVPEYWDNQPYYTFAPVRIFKPNNPMSRHYYHFSKKEYVE